MGKVLEMPQRAEPWENLNPEQRAAVEHGEGPLLVVAGAGTGKTRVITERIRHLLETQPGLSGEHILGLTFTNKAAAEMKHRVRRAVGDRGAAVRLSTFHAFCWSLLSEIHPGLKLLDEIDHWILLRRNMGALGLDIFKRIAEPGRFLGDFVQFFSRCQDELVPPEEYDKYVEELRAKFEREKAALDEAARTERELEVARQLEVARVYRISDRLLRDLNRVTYGGLLLRAVTELRENHALLEEWRARCRYILVDEFQDTNIAQIELLWLLAGRRRNIVAVGDDDQAIYRFRGASFGSFLLFLERFTGGKENQQPIQPLTRNYRSTQRILRVAGHVISMNEKSQQLPKKQLTAQGPAGEKIVIAEFPSAEQEAAWVADTILQMHRAGHGWGEFAVLYRAHAHRDRLVEVLTAREIPFVIRKLSILDTTLVRDVIAYLRLITYPADDVAAARVLAMPAWGLDAADLVRLAERAGKARGKSLWDELTGAQAELPFLRDAQRTAELADWIAGLRRRARQQSAAEFTDSLITELGLVLPADDPSHETLERLKEFAREWENKSENESVHDFVEYLSYFREAGGEISLEESEARNAVQLMTVHAAKGLEFDHVFVLRLVQGAFPTWARKPVLEFPPELMKEAKPQGDFHVQEERRLFYVAMTRAKKRLTLTTVVKKRSKPSAFLEDILMEPGIQKHDVVQVTPQVAAAPRVDVTSLPLEHLFGPHFAEARAYSQMAIWACRYRPPVAEPLQLSATSVEGYLDCPQRYLFSSRWGLRGRPHAAAAFGSVMHTTIREFVRAVGRNRRTPFEEVESIFAREWQAARFRDPYQEEEYRKAGLEQLRAFHSTYIQAPADVLHQEKFFELPLEPSVVVTGRIDQINRLGGGAEIVDYKTGRPKEVRDAEKSLQLSLYALAARELWNLDPIRLSFYNLTTNEPAAAQHDDKQIDKARATVLEVAAQIRAGDFPAKPGFHCRTCEYHSLCPAQEQLVAIRPARA
jgi:DNA helicase-2/ATP-dependent DNA helicase PcrA